MIVEVCLILVWLEREFECLKDCEKTWLKRLLVFVGLENSVVNMDNYFYQLSRLSLANYQQETLFIINVLQESGVFVSKVRIRHFKNMNSDFIKHKSSPRLVTSAQIEILYHSLSVRNKLFIAILASCGRRAIDVRRLCTSEVKVLQDKFLVRIYKDKVNNRPVNFSFQWDTTLDLPWKTIDSQFKNLLRQKSNFPFWSVKTQKIRDVIDEKFQSKKFVLHSLRNRCAIRLVRLDWSVDEVCSYIGWRTLSYDVF